MAKLAIVGLIALAGMFSFLFGDDPEFVAPSSLEAVNWNDPRLVVTIESQIPTGNRDQHVIALALRDAAQMFDFCQVSSPRIVILAGSQLPEHVPPSEVTVSDSALITLTTMSRHLMGVDSARASVARRIGVSTKRKLLIGLGPMAFETAEAFDEESKRRYYSQLLLHEIAVHIFAGKQLDASHFTNHENILSGDFAPSASNPLSSYCEDLQVLSSAVTTSQVATF